MEGIKSAVCLNTLNSRCVKNSWPLPLIRDNLEFMGGSHFFSSVDICGAYHSVKVREEARKKFAFVCPYGLYEYCRMPYGWTCSGPLFYKLMANVFGDLKWKKVAIYADDCMIFSKTFQDHVNDINETLDKLEGFRLSTTKCLFFQKKIDYLGFEVSKEGIVPGKKNVQRIQEPK